MAFGLVAATLQAGDVRAKEWPGRYITEYPPGVPLPHTDLPTQGPPHAFTDFQLYEMLKVLIETPEGKVTPKMVEKLFKVKLHPRPDKFHERVSKDFFTVHGEGGDWTYEISTLKAEKVWNFYFGWKEMDSQQRPLPPPGMCVLMERLEVVLKSENWEIGHRSGQPSLRYIVEYTKRNGQSVIMYTDKHLAGGGCINHIDIAMYKSIIGHRSRHGTE